MTEYDDGYDDGYSQGYDAGYYEGTLCPDEESYEEGVSETKERFKSMLRDIGELWFSQLSLSEITNSEKANFFLGHILREYDVDLRQYAKKMPY